MSQISVKKTSVAFSFFWPPVVASSDVGRWLNRIHSINSCHAISWTVLRAIPSCSLDDKLSVGSRYCDSYSCGEMRTGSGVMHTCIQYLNRGKMFIRSFLALFSSAYVYVYY